MKFWHFPEVRERQLIKSLGDLSGQVIVDIGGNKTYSFPPATHTVGWEGDIQLDLCQENLPFKDQSVDFVFCRHVIEDLADPRRLLSEIARVAKAGYLETPSVRCELTRGVDFAGIHRGYAHHRWLCYSDNRAFCAIAKYPAIENIKEYRRPPRPMSDYESWNFIYRFEGELDFQILQNEQGFSLSVYDGDGLFPVEYFDLVLEAAQ